MGSVLSEHERQLADLEKKLFNQYNQTRTAELKQQATQEKLTEMIAKENQWKTLKQKLSEELKKRENQWKTQEQKLSEELKEKENQWKAQEQKLFEELKAKENQWKAKEKKLSEELKVNENQWKAKEQKLFEKLKAKENQWKTQKQKLSEELKEKENQRKVQEQKLSEELKAKENQWKAQEQKLSEELKANENQWKAQEQILSEELKAMEKQRKAEERKHNQQIKHMEEKIKKMEKQINKMEADMQNDDYLKRIYRSRSKLLTRRPEKYLKHQKNLNINLFGETGTGKTSLINSLKYAVNGNLSDTYMEQTAPENFQGAHTMQRTKITLTEHLNIIDNRGVSAEQCQNPSFLNDVIRQMEGTKPKEATPVKNFSTKKKSYCAVMVFSAHQKDLVMGYKNFIRKLYEWQGRFPLAVITHVDEESSQHVRLVLGSLGVGDIYDVANITKSRKELELTYQCSLLELLERCFIYGDEICSYRHEMKGKS